jgi:two-component system LytT family sensor kinase
MRWWGIGRRDSIASTAGEATFKTLHTISLASPPLRSGLNRDSARKAGRHLRALLGAEAVAVAAAGADGRAELLSWSGIGGAAHRDAVPGHVEPVVVSGRPRVVPCDLVVCADPCCPLRVAIAVPLVVAGRAVGALAAYGPDACPARVRAAGHVARWVSGQLELAELDSSRARLADAELRALRAQISPHFVYNSLTTIASFVRTDPERARELLLDFADFARYSFRDRRAFTTLAEELRSVDRYLLLERARFGARLRFRVEVAPEVLPVAVPFLSLQPLVENAIRHGMDATGERFLIRIAARDSGTEAEISVEDDGVGMDPARLEEILSGGRGRSARGAGIGLANVDERLRAVYGDEYGLMIETGPGAGTRVSMRIPKCRPDAF